MTTMVTNHDNQLGEINPTMLNELKCTFVVSFSRLHWCGRHGHGLWPSWYRPPLSSPPVIIVRDRISTIFVFTTLDWF